MKATITAYRTIPETPDTYSAQVRFKKEATTRAQSDEGIRSAASLLLAELPNAEYVTVSFGSGIAPEHYTRASLAGPPGKVKTR